MTTVERIRRQFQDALGDLEMRVLLEQLEQNLPSLSLKQLGELLQSPKARALGDIPAAVLLDYVSSTQAKAARPTK